MPRACQSAEVRDGRSRCTARSSHPVIGRPARVLLHFGEGIEFLDFQHTRNAGIGSNDATRVRRRTRTRIFRAGRCDLARRMLVALRTASLVTAQLFTTTRPRPPGEARDRSLSAKFSGSPRDVSTLLPSPPDRAPVDTCVAPPRMRIGWPGSQATVSDPPGIVTFTGELARLVLIAATAVAQAPVPQARVSPAPRSQVRKRTPSLSSWATLTLMRSGKAASFSMVGPMSSSVIASASSTKNMRCGVRR